MIALSAMDLVSWLSALAIILLILLSAFFSGSETALTAASRGKLRAQADRGERGARCALSLKEDGERLLGAILLGNNFVNILATSLATVLLTRLIGEGGVALATFAMTALVLIFGEVLPKTYAIAKPETTAARVSRVVQVVVVVLAPVVAVVRALVRVILKLFGVGTDPNRAVLSYREEIEGALALGHSEGTVEKEHRDRLLGALDLGDRTVEEVMLHRSQIEMVNIEAPVAEIVARCVASSHTRLPVWQGEPENIVGIIHSRDLLRALHKMLVEEATGPAALASLDIRALLRPAYFVPATTTLDAQLKNFIRDKRHFALVVDEYGALLGLITLEDILEEIVGEIKDEHDVETAEPIVRIDENTIEVEGTMTIRDLNRAMDWTLPDDVANTVAGLVIHEAQMIPEVGQVFRFHGFRYEVREKIGNRLTKIRIRHE